MKTVERRRPVVAKALSPVGSLMMVFTCGCGAKYGLATNGQAYGFKDRSTWNNAVIASAEHDIPCARSQVRVVLEETWEDNHESLYVLEGCGGRVSYVTQSDDAGIVRYVLIGRVNVGTGPAPAPLRLRATP